MKLPFRLSSMVDKAERDARRFGLSASEARRLRLDAVASLEEAMARGIPAELLTVALTTDKAGSVALYAGDLFSVRQAAQARIARDAAFFPPSTSTAH